MLTAALSVRIQIFLVNVKYRGGLISVPRVIPRCVKTRFKVYNRITKPAASSGKSKLIELKNGTPNKTNRIEGERVYDQ